MDDALHEDTATHEEGEAHYANYLEVGHNAVEFLLLFGQQNGSARVFTRVYTTPAHALSFSELLRESVAEYEQKYRPIRPLAINEPGNEP